MMMTAVRKSARPMRVALLVLLCSWPCVAPLTPPETDYDVFEDPSTPAPRIPTPTPNAKNPNSNNRTEPRLCDHDVCREDEAPCLQQAALSGCLCQGITMETVPPEAPSGRPWTRDGPGVAVVHWCAPYSIVTHYSVRVAGRERLRVGGGRRSSGRLEGLNPGDEVCVRAENAAGPGPESCQTYAEEDEGPGNVSLKAGLVAGALLGLVLVLVLLGVLVRRCQRPRRTSGAGTMADSQQAPPDCVTLDVF
ncbi:unnamed protein product [Merluccius merluccius]